MTDKNPNHAAEEYAAADFLKAKASSTFENQESKPYKILSLNGGGVRAIFQTTILQELSKDPRLKDFWKDFDLIIGTSAGAIVGAGLKNNKSPEEIEKFFEDAKDLFPPEWLVNLFRFMDRPKVSRAKEIVYDLIWPFVGQFTDWYVKEVAEGFLRSQMDDCSERLETKLSNFLKNTNTMGEFCSEDKCFAVTASLVETSAVRVFFPYFFEHDNEIDLVKAVLASASPPGFFNAVKVDEIDWNTGELRNPTREYIDGGLWANSPALSAVAVAHCDGNKALENIRLINIGTGSKPYQVTHGKYKQINAKYKKDELLWHLVYSLGTLAMDKDRQGVCRFLKKKGQLDVPYKDAVTDDALQKNVLYIDAEVDDYIELWNFDMAQKYLPAAAREIAPKYVERVCELLGKTPPPES
jgi:predicted acylesterase/phospholipase RssA